MIAIITAKAVLLAVACPASLCVVQFVVAAFGSRQLIGSVPAVGRAERNLVVGIALSYAGGFLLTNAAIAIAAPSFVETFKAAEPLSTVALATFALGEWERPRTLLALLPIVMGVALASSGSGATFSVFGMLLALASNISFSGRAVLTKALQRGYPAAEAASSDACLFYHVSRLGMWLLLPVALLLDTRALLDALGFSSGSSSVGSTGVAADAGAEGAQLRGTSSAWLALLLLANGCAHATYNGVSFMVLGRVSAATHAVLNIVRRVAVIGVSAAFFGTYISPLNASGIALAAVGVLGFGRSRSVGAAGTTRRRAVLLPIAREV